MRTFLMIIFFLGLIQWGFAQEDEVVYDKYFHTTLGAGYGLFGGNIGDHLRNTIGVGTSLGAGISRNESINLNFAFHFTDTTDDPFALDAGATARERPDILNVGIGYDRVFGTASESHFHGQLGVGYSWLGYQDEGSRTSGIVPALEIGWAQLFKSKVGSTQGSTVRYSRGGARAFNVMTGSGQSHYRPVMTGYFIDFFLNYNYLNHSNTEAKGHMVLLGVRYKKIVYSEEYIPGEN